MLEVFHHNTESGLCTYVALPHKDMEDYIDLAVRFLKNEKVEIDGLMGSARLHPEDGNYRKSTGRDVSRNNAKSVNFYVASVSKTLDSRTRIFLINNEYLIRVDVLVKKDKRIHLRIVP